MPAQDDLLEGTLLVHGVWFASRRPRLDARRARFARLGRSLGVDSYELIETRHKRLANGALRKLRGTSRAPDAVEILSLRPDAPALHEQPHAWRALASCEMDGLNAARSFALTGRPRHPLRGARGPVRILWFGRGLPHLSEQEFAAHYLDVHGPLVAGRAARIGLRSYLQLRADRSPEHSAALVEAGLGSAPAPPVFAELTLGLPEDLLRGAARRRRATGEIAADERRHIDFGRSMMLLG